MNSFIMKGNYNNSPSTTIFSNFFLHTPFSTSYLFFLLSKLSVKTAAVPRECSWMQMLLPTNYIFPSLVPYPVLLSLDSVLNLDATKKNLLKH